MSALAKDVAGDATQLIERILIKYTKAMLEEFKDQLKQRDRKINQLKTTIGTAISCLQVELGEQAVKVLVKGLDEIKD